MTGVGDHDHRFCLSLASLVMAEQLTTTEPDELRRQRKATVAQEKWGVLRDAFADELGDLQGYGGTGPALRQLTQVLEQRAAPWTPAQRWLLLVDLVMSDVFAPYELRVPIHDFGEALRHVAATLDLADECTDLLDGWSDLLRARTPRRWRTVISPGVLTASTLTTSGPDAATAAALATAAGLTGDAATAHGFALLGGGSLAVGSGHLAGGMWLVTIASDDDGPLPGGGHGLLALGPAQARVELIKLQLSTRFVIDCGLASDVDADDVGDALALVSDELRAQLAVERRVNDDDAARISDIDAMLATVDATRQHVGVVEIQAA